DCIPFNQQPTVRTALKAGRKVTDKAPEPPALEAELSSDSMQRPPVPTPIVPPLHRGLVDPFGHPIACPEGLVPLRRVTLAQMAQYGKFENFFRKQRGQPAAGPVAKGKRKAAAKGRKAPAKKKTSGRKSPTAPQFGNPGDHLYAVCQDTHGGPY